MLSTDSAGQSPLRIWLRGAGMALARQLAKFGIVGAFTFVIDVGIFNLLLHAGSNPPLAGQPLLAKVISTVVATVAAWLGNRYWTFRHSRRPEVLHELLVYTVVCTIGLGISLVVLWFSHYVLGLTSALADNLFGNVIGIGLASVFRFWAYRKYVFTHELEDEDALHEMETGSPVRPVFSAETR